MDKKGTSRDGPTSQWAAMHRGTNVNHLQEQLALRDAEIRALTDICSKIFPSNRKAEWFDVIFCAKTVKCWSLNCHFEGQTTQHRIGVVEGLISKALEIPFEFESAVTVQPARLEVQSQVGSSCLWIPLKRVHLCVLGPEGSASVAVVHQTRLSITPCCSIFKCGTLTEAKLFASKLLGACNVVWKGAKEKLRSDDDVNSTATLTITPPKATTTNATTTTTTNGITNDITNGITNGITNATTNGNTNTINAATATTTNSTNGNHRGQCKSNSSARLSNSLGNNRAVSPSNANTNATTTANTIATANNTTNSNSTVNTNTIANTATSTANTTTANTNTTNTTANITTNSTANTNTIANTNTNTIANTNTTTAAAANTNTNTTTFTAIKTQSKEKSSRKKIIETKPTKKILIETVPPPTTFVEIQPSEKVDAFTTAIPTSHKTKTFDTPPPDDIAMARHASQIPTESKPRGADSSPLTRRKTTISVGSRDIFNVSPESSPLGRRKFLGLTPLSPLGGKPDPKNESKPDLKPEHTNDRLLSPTINRKRMSLASLADKSDYRVRTSTPTLTEKQQPSYSHVVACLLSTKYVGDTDLTKFHKIDGNNTQIQMKVDQALKSVCKRLQSKNSPEFDTAIVTFSKGFLRTPRLPSESEVKSGVILGKNIRTITVGFAGGQMERSCFAVIHGSITDDSITCSMFCCSNPVEAKRCVSALASIIQGMSGPSITSPSKLAQSPTLTRKNRKHKRSMEIVFYGLVEFSGVSSRLLHAQNAVETLKTSVCPEKGNFSVGADVIHICNSVDSSPRAVFGLDQVLDVIVVKSFCVVVWLWTEDDTSRVYACVVGCANHNVASDAASTILSRLNTAVIASLTSRVSQNATTFWNLCTQLKDLSQSVKLERVKELLASIPKHNNVESTFATYQGFCHDIAKPGLLLNILFRAGLLDKTDAQGFSIPLCAGNSYDHAVEVMKKREAKLAADWKRIEHESENFSEAEKSALRIKTFQTTGLPKDARHEVWWTFIGQPHQFANKRKFNFYLKLSGESLDADEKLQILKDVPRTFGHTNYRFSPANQRNILPALENILMANHARKPGTYWQGMSFIAAFILVHFPKVEQAFWIFVGVLDEILPLVFGSLGPAIENKLFGEVLADKLPALAHHLTTLDIPPEILCTEWFMCAFTTSLPYQTTTQMWDIMILTITSHRVHQPTLTNGVSADGNVGVDLLLYFAILLIRMCETELLQQDDIAELSEFLKQKLQLTWTLPDVSFSDSIDGATDSVAHMLEAEQTFLWTSYVDAKRNRLNKELEFSTKQVEKLRRLDNVFNVHASEDKMLTIQEFTAICLDLSGAIDENNGILFIKARDAFEEVDVKGSGSIDYDQFMSACRLLPAINNMMQLADLTGDSAVERLRSLFHQHADDHKEISREQLFGLVRTVYIATGQTQDQQQNNMSPMSSPSASSSRRASGVYGFDSADLESVMDDVVEGLVSDNNIISDSNMSPFGRNKPRSRSLHSKFELDITDDRERSDSYVSEMRRWRTVAGRLYDNMDPNDHGRVGFAEFARHARRSPVFTLAMSLLGGNKPQLNRGSPSLSRADSRFQKIERLATGSSTSSTDMLPSSLSTMSASLVGNPFFCFSVESESFSVRIEGYSRVDTKRKRGKKTIEYEIVISCEFSEKQKVYRSFDDFDRFYKTLIAMSKVNGRLPVKDVALLLNVDFPKKALAAASADTMIVQRQRLLQKFLDATQMMQSPEVREEVSKFLTRFGHFSESAHKDRDGQSFSTALAEEDESELF